MTILLLAAMSTERALLGRALSGVRRARRGGAVFAVGECGAATVVLSETGIGKVNAALGAARGILAWRPDAVLSSGVAGGLAEGFAPGDVVAASEVVYHDVDCGPGNVPGQVQGLPPRFPADPGLLAAAIASRPANGRAPVAAVLASGDEFVRTAARRRAVLSRVPDAAAVDMESGAIAQTCFLRGVPFLSLRVLSDTPGSTRNHAAQYANFWDALAGSSFGAVRALLEAVSLGVRPRTKPAAAHRAAPRRGRKTEAAK